MCKLEYIQMRPASISLVQSDRLAWQLVPLATVVHNSTKRNRGIALHLVDGHGCLKVKFTLKPLRLDEPRLPGSASVECVRKSKDVPATKSVVVGLFRPARDPALSPLANRNKPHKQGNFS